jgi:hypothetical protein
MAVSPVYLPAQRQRLAMRRAPGVAAGPSTRHRGCSAPRTCHATSPLSWLGQGLLEGLELVSQAARRPRWWPSWPRRTPLPAREVADGVIEARLSDRYSVILPAGWKGPTPSDIIALASNGRVPRACPLRGARARAAPCSRRPPHASTSAGSMRGVLRGAGRRSAATVKASAGLPARPERPPGGGRTPRCRG